MTKPQIRSSQVITTFGVGALVDLPDDAVIIAGLDSWKYNQNNIQSQMITERRLIQKLEVLLDFKGLTLRKPPPAVEDHGFTPDITAYRFPEWFIVQEAIITPKKQYRARRLVKLHDLKNGKYIDQDGKRQTVVPVRFVRACEKGHVGDIDWRAFVHRDKRECHRTMFLEERGTTGNLDSIWVRCDCGAEQPMSLAARRDQHTLGQCDGSRPWLGPGNREGCGLSNRLLIRSASNAYFPQLLSVISIPDSQDSVTKIVSAHWESLLCAVETDEDLQRFITRIPVVKQQLKGFSSDQIMTAINSIRNEGASEDRSVKEVEFEALSAAEDELGSDVPDGDFYASKLARKIWDTPWMNAIERIVLVHRLREVVAQVGFTRFESAGPDIDGELAIDVQRAPLGLDIDWLPAMENRGEGIFIQFRSDAIEDWLKQDEVVTRDHQLQNGFNLWLKDHSGSKRKYPGLPYYFLHTFSHLLITAISLECGYPVSSIRERVYARPGEYGLLIYTASSDAEGTLGGLVQTGQKIHYHIKQALEAGRLCSNDPVCSYHSPTEHDHQSLLGSACHGCLLISETSCEQHNDFLDRALVIPTVELLGAEFFKD